MRIVRLEKTGSTNTVAREMFEAGERDPLWIVAERQTAGRGRLDRNWVSESGNLYASALVPRPDAPIGAMAFISACAVAETVTHFAGAGRVTLKWPNDVLLDSRKVSGILCETVEEHVICGIGINAAHHPSDTRWPATHLAEHAPDVTADDVLMRLDADLQSMLAALRDTSWDAMRQRWLDRAYGLGSEVAVETGGRRRAGRFRGLGPDGEFLLSTPSGTVPIVAGDVTYSTRPEG